MNANRDSKNRFKNRLVYGVGLNDSETPVRVNGKLTPSYSAWSSMLSRCLSEKYKNRQKTYRDCIVCEKWKRFSNFKVWFENNYRPGYALDKDILKRGNKMYCPEFCSFVPREINNLIEKSNSIRGPLPIGVAKYKDRYRCYLTINNNVKHIGVFDAPEAAFAAYKDAKEAHIKQVAQEYFDAGKISKRVYDALMRYEVAITD